MWQTKSSKFSIVLISGLLIASCSGMGPTSNANTMTPESSQIPTFVPEITATSVLLPTETKLASTPLPLIETKCLTYPNEIQKSALSGIVAFGEKSRPLDLSALGFFLLDVKNRNVIKTVDEGVYEQISPDRKYLAYEYSSSDRQSYLRILDSSGKTISDFHFHIYGRWQSFFNWQNATELRTIQQEQDSKVAIHLLNPFTLEHTPLRTDWKDVYTPKNPFADKLVQWKFDERLTRIAHVYGANILYDPSLTHVFYPKDDGVVSLMNAEDETELASAQFEDWGRLPSWSPDGQYLTIVNHEGNTDEFYLISRDGNEFQKITDFAREFELATIPEYSWSPDGKQIAFWLNTESMERELGAQAELALIDVIAKQVTRLCIQGISVPAIEPWTMNHPKPIWSPDGKYIMITQWDNAISPKQYEVLVIETQTGAIQKVSENTAPIGWMSSE